MCTPYAMRCCTSELRPPSFTEPFLRSRRPSGALRAQLGQGTQPRVVVGRPHQCHHVIARRSGKPRMAYRRDRDWCRYRHRHRSGAGALSRIGRDGRVFAAGASVLEHSLWRRSLFRLSALLQAALRGAGDARTPALIMLRAGLIISQIPIDVRGRKLQRKRQILVWA